MSHQLGVQSPVDVTNTNIAGYAIKQFIGRGSYSTVYKAHKNRGSYQVVAIKCIQISTLSAKSKDNLFNEINILRRINHQNVVAMKKFTWDARHVYLILEYCPGGNLAEFIRSKGRLSEFMVQHFAQQLVQGLEVLHAEKIVHSDLKPANILLSIPPVGSCRNVKLKIADFGFSRKLQANEKYTMGIKGSPLYMAPEVLRSQPYSSQADLYSLGVILYECLFGSTPYRTNDLSQLTKRILSKDPIKIPKTIDIGEDCYDLLSRLLVKDQEKRMNFERLYRHQFIDIEHCPTLENYYKGVSLVRQATIFDNARNYEDARAFYVEALLYLVPVYHWLDSFNDNQRKWLSKRVQEYCARAEQISLIHLSVKS
uniref:Serine/threonine-protein kinase ULK3 n=1 Tax=Aceria tosichella TaxID=561515 RepID=A0A6G1SAC2_9ACAR